ncbi:hypothetical protein HD806DRAFT_500253 [Xylariaceae sp. AK1471]|nr:hypothetical protein HD806DRAFT_500253 [Xylariaceae sp. AK1471]
MRGSYIQRRKVSGFRISVRDDEKPQDGVPSDSKPLDDEPSDDELSADDDTDDEGEPDTPPPTTTTFPPSSLPLETTTTSISSQSMTPTAPSTTQLTTPAAPATTLLTTSKPPKETVTVTTSSKLAPSDTSSTSLPPTTSTLSSPIINLPIASTSVLPVLNPTDRTSTTPVLPEITGDASQSENTLSPSDDRTVGASHSSKRAGEIAGATVGSIALIAIIFFAIWMWRRRRNRDSAHDASRTSGMPMPADDNMQYRHQQPRGHDTERSPSSIMNQLMTAAYAAEDGMGYRNSEQDFDHYAAAEKPRFVALENESMERLTVPAGAQLRHQSIAARTETTNRTESTWKTWGVLAGSSQPPPGPRNWWVDRYFRTHMS